LEAMKALNDAGIDLSSTLELTDKRSVNAFNSFLRNTDGVLELRESLEGVNEQFKTMETERLNSLGGSLVLFRSQLEAVYLNLGLEGALRGIVDAGTNFLSFLNAVSGGSSRAADGIRSASEEVKLSLAVLKQENLTYQERQTILQRLRDQYGDYLNGIDLEQAGLEGILRLEGQIDEIRDNKLRDIANQNAYNDSLAEEERLLNLITIARKAGESSRFRKGAADQSVRDNLDEVNRLRGERLDLLSGIDINKITTDQFLDLNNGQYPGLRNRAQVSKIISDIKTAALEEFQKPLIVGGVDVGLNEGIAGLLTKVDNAKDGKSKERIKKQVQEAYNTIQTELRRLEGLRDQYRSGTQLRAELDNRINLLQDFGENSRLALGDLRGGFGGGGRGSSKAEEVFAKGSIAYLEKILKEAEEVLKKAGTGSDFEKLTVDVEEARKNLEAAKKALDDLYTTPKEAYDEAIKSYDIFLANKTNLLKSQIEDEKELQLQLALASAEIEKQKLEALKKFQIESGEKTGLTDEKIKAAEKDYSDATKELEKYLKVKAEDIALIEKANAVDVESFAEKEARKTLIYKEAQAERLREEIAAEKDLRIKDKSAQELAALNEEIFEIRGKLNTEYYKKDAEALKDYNVEVEGLIKKGGKNMLTEIEKVTERFTLESEIRIAQSNLETAVLSGNSEKIAKAQAKLNDAIANYAQFNLNDSGAKLEKFRDNLLKTVELLETISSGLANFFNVSVDRDLEDERQQLDEYYKAKLDAAKGNKEEEERLSQEKEDKIAAIEKRAAERRRQIALKEAYIALALGLIKAAATGDPFAAAQVAATGFIQIATIKRQTYARGGYKTGHGFYPDVTGEYRTSDELHDGEYVVKRKTVERYPHIIRFLEDDRQRYLGFARGGYFGVGSMPQVYGGDEYARLEGLFTGFVSSFGPTVYEAVRSGAHEGAMAGSAAGNSANYNKRLSRAEALAINRY